jgi:deoxyribonuclease V
MDVPIINNWPQTYDQAKQLQLELAPRVICRDWLPEKISLVAGLDVGFEEHNTIAKAAVAVLSFPDLELIETAIARQPVSFPYIPGYLSFREVPVLMAALAKLHHKPDLLLCDGQGLAHPRRFGLACHLGVLLNMATIGVAKSKFIGLHEPLPLAKGSWVPLIDKDEAIGAVLRTRTKTKPLYISVGHRISLATAIELVMVCTPTYRLPETTRYADRLSKVKDDEAGGN